MNEEIYPIIQKSENKSLIRFSLAGTTFPDKNYRIHRAHSYTACIEYIEEGCGTVEIDGQIFFPSAGDSYFLHEGSHQHYYADTQTPWKKHFINLSGKLLHCLTEGYGLDGIFYFKGLDLKEEISHIIALAKDVGHDRTAEMVTILTAIFMKMRAHARQTQQSISLGNAMKDFLNTKITEKFRMEELCRYVGRSESQTIRIFKNDFGVTPYVYLLDKKISLSKTLLSNTTLSVKQIAEKLCFSDEYYFSNLFKKKTGLSPLSYRKAEETLSQQ